MRSDIPCKKDVDQAEQVWMAISFHMFYTIPQTMFCNWLVSFYIYILWYNLQLCKLESGRKDTNLNASFFTSMIFFFLFSVILTFTYIAWSSEIIYLEGYPSCISFRTLVMPAHFSWLNIIEPSNSPGFIFEFGFIHRTKFVFCNQKHYIYSKEIILKWYTSKIKDVWLFLLT